MRQDEAFSLLKMGKNVFLTGEAGSGKTYLLNQYIHYLKAHQVEVAVTASTGIAATHLQGTTIHSWSGIGVRDHLAQKDLEKLLTTDRIKRNYQKTKVLIIDEISMLHQHQLDMVDTIARYILKCDQAFGGIQMVLCGDFFQLPPVSSVSSVEEKQFAFESSAWRAGDFQVCYLHEQHRQGNDPLLTVLNDIRSGTAGEHTKIPLRTRYKKEPQGSTKATKLGDIRNNVVFLGGCTTGLFISDPIVPDVRYTLDEKILGFGNRWYKEAIACSTNFPLTNKLVIRVVTAP
jgi:ATP-dependent DNA helicase PIF1